MKSENERLMADVEKLKQRLREEITRTTAGVRLDLNLEKGEWVDCTLGWDLCNVQDEESIAGRGEERRRFWERWGWCCCGRWRSGRTIPSMYAPVRAFFFFFFFGLAAKTIVSTASAFRVFECSISLTLCASIKALRDHHLSPACAGTTVSFSKSGHTDKRAALSFLPSLSTLLDHDPDR